MKKFYYKKDNSIEESSTYLPLERRHTMDVDQDVVAAGKKLKSASRSTSVSSVGKSPSTGDSDSAKSAENTLSPGGDNTCSISNASTVVITESELSSSWLYKNKKAQMNTSDALESTCESTAQLAPKRDERKSPISPRPISKPNNVGSARNKKRSCCYYLHITFVIVVSTLFVMLAIGGVLYKQLFAGSNDPDYQPVTDRYVPETTVDDFYPMRKIGLVVGENEANQDENLASANGIDLLKFEVSSSDDKVSNIDVNMPDITKESHEDSDVHININLGSVLPESDLSLPVDDDLYSVAKSNNVRIDTHAEPIQTKLNQNEALHPVSSSSVVPNNKEEHEYSKLFELYKNVHKSSFGNDSDSNDSDLKDSNPPEALDSKVSHLDSSSVSDPDIMERLLTDKDGLSNSILEDTKFELDKMAGMEESDNLAANVQTLIPMILPRDDQALENDNSELSIPGGSLNENSKLDDTIPDSEEQNFEVDDPALSVSPELNPSRVDPGPDEPIELNRPILEANIAVPFPLEFIRRLQLERGNVNNIGQPDIDVEQHDRKFSLSKALEQLRLLDVNSKLPSSRTKVTSTRKPRSIQTDEEVGEERSHYLHNLRRKIFDK